MGGSGGGGGSAGDVSWPAYVSDKYTALLGDFAGVTTVTGALTTAQDANPYEVIAYDPSFEVDRIRTAIDLFHDITINYEPIALWDTIFGQAISRYNSVVGNDPVFIRAEPNAWIDIGDIWVYVASVLNAADDIGTSWATPTLDADVDIKADMAAADTIAAAVSAYGDRLDDRITSEVLPRFEAGMRDINAVQSSAFVIGRAIIEGMADRDVANFDAELTNKAYMQRDNLLGQAHMQIDKLNAVDVDGKNKSLSQAYLQDDKIQGDEVANLNKLRAQALIQSDQINADSLKADSLVNAEMLKNRTALVYQDTDSLLKHGESYLDLIKAWSGFVVDSNRITYVMHKEEDDRNVEYEVNNAKWDMDMVQIAGNLVASISGGTSYTPGPTPAQNALGGAFAGASLGARASGGNPYGTAAGAVLGGIGAYLMG